ncbi:aldehyde dehydrogenase family protein, partial [Mycobacterium kansasii]
MTATASSPTLSGALLIGGERITAASGGTYRHVYPGTGLPNASIPLAGRSEVDRAVDSAWDAHREWMSYPVDRRRDLLFALADVVRDHFAELSELNV